MPSWWTQLHLYPDRAIKTLSVVLCFVSQGMISGILGPTLLDLQSQVQTDLHTISFALVARSAGHGLGCLLIPFIYSRINFNLLIAICMTHAMIFTSLIPFMTSPALLLTDLLVNQIAFGAFEAGSTIYLLNMWGRETTPFMQALNFMFGIGSLIGPTIAAPFLVERKFDSLGHEIPIKSSEIHLMIPYFIVSATMMANAAFAYVVWIKWPITTPHPSRITHTTTATTTSSTLNGSKASAGDIYLEEKTNQMMNQSSFPQVDVQKLDHSSSSYRIWKFVVIICVLVFMHIYLGFEITFGSYMAAYAVNCDLKLTKEDGAHLSTLFWTTFTLFRILVVFVTDFLGQEMCIWISLIICLASNVFLLPFGQTSVSLLCIGVALIGIGISAIWAAVFGFLEEHFPITPTISASIVIFAVLGEFVFPTLISFFIESHPIFLMWTTLFCSCACTFIFLIFSSICRFKLGKLIDQ